MSEDILKLLVTAKVEGVEKTYTVERVIPEHCLFDFVEQISKQMEESLKRLENV